MDETTLPVMLAIPRSQRFIDPAVRVIRSLAAREFLFHP